MAKAELKTRPHDGSVEDFLNSVTDEQQRRDSFRLLGIFERISAHRGQMWGNAIVGFGQQMLKYASGRELDWPIVAFSPRKGTLVLYLSATFEHREELLAKLGKHKTSTACIYIKRLADVDEKILEKLIAASIASI
ncbi:MAG: DUF1801 domain-containing protein [Pyrinomonadaceae bacterium]